MQWLSQPKEVLTGMNLVAIDTLHLFPTALECAKLVEEKYAKKAEPAKMVSYKKKNSQNNSIYTRSSCNIHNNSDKILLIAI